MGEKEKHCPTPAVPKEQVKATALGLGQSWPHLLPVFFILNGIHCTARLGIEHEVKASVFAEAAGIAEEGILLVVIDGSIEPKYLGEGGNRGLVWGGDHVRRWTVPPLYCRNRCRDYQRTATNR